MKNVQSFRLENEAHILKASMIRASASHIAITHFGDLPCPVHFGLYQEGIISKVAWRGHFLLFEWLQIPFQKSVRRFLLFDANTLKSTLPDIRS